MDILREVLLPALVALTTMMAGLGYCLGTLLTSIHEPFNHWKITNPIQDWIRWCPIFVQMAFWPLFVALWGISGWLGAKRWEAYTSHEMRVESELWAMHRRRDVVIYYTVPSPRKWRKYGLAAIEFEEGCPAP